VNEITLTAANGLNLVYPCKRETWPKDAMPPWAPEKCLAGISSANRSKACGWSPRQKLYVLKVGIPSNVVTFGGINSGVGERISTPRRLAANTSELRASQNGVNLIVRFVSSCSYLKLYGWWLFP
jgi:hypothetical protein